MPSLNTTALPSLLSALMLIACSNNDKIEPRQDNNTASSTLADHGLLATNWTLETVRDDDGIYRPLPLGATWRLNFESGGRVSGNALCNGGSGIWQASDMTLSIVHWAQTEIDCESSDQVPARTDEIVSRLFIGEIVMPTLDSGRLFFNFGDNTQLVFSARARRTDEQLVSIQTLVHSGGGARASNGDPVFGDLESPYVVYRDAESLITDFSLLPAEEVPWPTLPDIDFTKNVVIGVYLPLDGAISSNVVIRNAWIADTGLEIEVAHFDPSVPDDVIHNSCDSATALSAPYTLVRVNSVVEPVIFSDMARAFCSGIPTRTR